MDGRRRDPMLLAAAVPAAGLIVAGVATVAGAGGTRLVSTWLLVVCVAASAAACLLRARAQPGAERAAWAVMAAGMVAWAAAEAVYALVVVHQRPEPSPSLADALWLAQYPASAVCLAALVRRRVGRVPAGFWVDAALGASAVAAVALAVLPVGEGVLGIAYPAGDVLMLVLVAGALGVSGAAWSTSWALLAAAFCVQVVADGAYLLSGPAYVAGGWADLGWPASALLVALAAVAARTAPTPATGLGLRLATSLSFGGAAVAVQVADHFGGVATSSVLLSALALVLLLVRVGLLLRTVHDLGLASAAEARRDNLTGLGNRRALLERLDALGGRHRLVLYDLDGFKAYNDAFGHPAGDALLRRLADRLAGFAGREGAAAYRLGGDEFCLLLPAGPRADAVQAGGAASLAESGEGFVVTASGGAAALPHPGGSSGALSEADAAMYAVKRNGRRSAAGQSEDVLDAAVRECRPALADHDSDVADLAGRVALALGLEPAAVEEVRRAGRLHDVGKIAIPDAILGKPGPLDPDEVVFVRNHTIIGQRIIGAATDLAGVAALVRSSHERWDGAGYPDGLAEEAIPLGARVVCACDAYDAIVTDRPYQAARTPSAALAELHRCAGAQFDPRVVEALARVLARPAAVAL